MLRLWKRIQRVPPTAPARGLFPPSPCAFERIAYLQAVAVVAAKLAKCDGPVKRSEIDCFKRLFPLEGHEHSAVGPLFNLARESPDGFEPFVAEIVRMLGEDAGARRALLDGLIRIGEADGPLNRAECDFLGGLAAILGLHEFWLSREERREEADPYAVLGVESGISDEELRVVWHRLIRRFHPDAAAARGEGEADHSRVAAINAAYRRIRRVRRRQASV